MKSPRQPLGRAEKWCLAATLLCAVPLVVAPIWWQHQNADAVVNFPAVKMPNPNAYDFTVSAANQLVPTEGRHIEYSIWRYKAGDWIPKMPIGANAPSSSTGPAPSQQRAYSLPEKTWLLNQNAPALKTLRQGFAFPFLQPPPYEASSDPDPTSDASRWRNWRRMPSLLLLEAQLKRERGDWSGALDSCLDGVRLGTDMARGAELQGAQLGQMCESMTRAEAWPSLSHLTLAQARRASLRMQVLQNGRVRFAQTLREEKWARQAEMVRAFRDPNWRNVFNRDTDGNGNRSSFRWRGAFISKQEVVDILGRNMDAQIAQAKSSYPKRGQSAAAIPPSLNSILGSGVSESESDWRTGFAQAETQGALLMTALALQTFQLEHKKFPKTLNELVPRYLKSVPLDPFSDNQPLRYKPQTQRYIEDIRQIPTGRSTIKDILSPGARRSVKTRIPDTRPQFEYSIWPYTLYSIGSDGRDDGGKPIENAGETTSARFRYSSRYGNNQGDIVAGINR